MADQTVTVTNESPAPEPIKPGWKTTEFWLSTVVTVIGIMYGTGLIAPGTVWDKIIGFVSAALVAGGYSVSRGIVKK